MRVISLLKRVQIPFDPCGKVIDLRRESDLNSNYRMLHVAPMSDYWADQIVLDVLNRRLKVLQREC